MMMEADVAGSNPGAVTSYFGIGAVLMMLTMVHLGAYLYNNNKVSYSIVPKLPGN